MSDCGTYVATEIYRATDAGGPYTLLTSLADRNVTEYADDNPGGEQLFYYLRYLYSCSDEPLTSDTLDSFIPATPEIRFISVIDGDAILYWNPSRSPEVNRYVIVDVSSGNSVPIDTVGEVSSYRFPLADGLRQEARYRVVALDACGNDSPLSETRSIFPLSAVGGTGCVQDVQLFPGGNDPDAYFDTGPDSSVVSFDDTVRLYTGLPGQPLTLYSTQAATGVAPLATYPEINNGEEICFAVEFAFAGDSVRQRSDTACYQFFLEQAVRDFDLYGVEIQPDGSLRFGYEDGVLQPDDYAVALEVAGANDTLLYEPGADLFPGKQLVTGGAIPLVPGEVLRFVLTDSCGRTANTNYVSPVWLTVSRGTGAAADLDWTAPSDDLPGSLTYSVFRIQNDSTTVPLATGLTDPTYVDSDSVTGVRCYQIEARYVPPSADTAYTFLSNIQCVVDAIDVYLPNVFSPDANRDANREFRPYFNTTAGLTEYSLRVFDRWGALVFESENVEEGWTGQIGGRGAAIGSYVYTLSYKPVGGNIRQLTGVVHLVR